MGIMGQPRRKKIEGETPIYTTVEEILENAKINGFITDCCLDIESLIKKNGIMIQRIKMPPSESGRLRQDNGQWIIEINSQHNEKRQRFTLAHELAHFFCHKNFQTSFTDNEIFYRSEESDSIEQAANRFASNLLMPEESVKNLIRKGTTNIEALANQFNVSSMAMRIQLLNLGYKLK